MANANALLTRVKAGEADYQFIEVMACPGGCVNGGGQPHQTAAVHNLVNVTDERAQALYRNDENRELRKAQDNPEVQTLYREMLGEPGSEKAHQLLHTSYVIR